MFVEGTEQPVNTATTPPFNNSNSKNGVGPRPSKLRVIESSEGVVAQGSSPNTSSSSSSGPPSSSPNASSSSSSGPPNASSGPPSSSSRFGRGVRKGEGHISPLNATVIRELLTKKKEQLTAVLETALKSPPPSNTSAATSSVAIHSSPVEKILDEIDEVNTEQRALDENIQLSQVDSQLDTEITNFKKEEPEEVQLTLNEADDNLDEADFNVELQEGTASTGTASAGTGSEGKMSEDETIYQGPLSTLDKDTIDAINKLPPEIRDSQPNSKDKLTLTTLTDVFTKIFRQLLPAFNPSKEMKRILITDRPKDADGNDIEGDDLLVFYSIITTKGGLIKICKLFMKDWEGFGPEKRNPEKTVANLIRWILSTPRSQELYGALRNDKHERLEEVREKEMAKAADIRRKKEVAERESIPYIVGIFLALPPVIITANGLQLTNTDIKHVIVIDNSVNPPNIIYVLATTSSEVPTLIGGKPYCKEFTKIWSNEPSLSGANSSSAAATNVASSTSSPVLDITGLSASRFTCRAFSPGEQKELLALENLFFKQMRRPTLTREAGNESESNIVVSRKLIESESSRGEYGTFREFLEQSHLDILRALVFPKDEGTILNKYRIASPSGNSLSSTISGNSAAMPVNAASNSSSSGNSSSSTISGNSAGMPVNAASNSLSIVEHPLFNNTLRKNAFRSLAMRALKLGISYDDIAHDTIKQAVEYYRILIEVFPDFTAELASEPESPFKTDFTNFLKFVRNLPYGNGAPQETVRASIVSKGRAMIELMNKYPAVFETPPIILAPLLTDRPDTTTTEDRFTVSYTVEGIMEMFKELTKNGLVLYCEALQNVRDVVEAALMTGSPIAYARIVEANDSASSFTPEFAHKFITAYRIEQAKKGNVSNTKLTIISCHPLCDNLTVIEEENTAKYGSTIEFQYVELPFDYAMPYATPTFIERIKIQTLLVLNYGGEPTDGTVTNGVINPITVVLSELYSPVNSGPTQICVTSEYGMRTLRITTRCIDKGSGKEMPLHIFCIVNSDGSIQPYLVHPGDVNIPVNLANSMSNSMEGGSRGSGNTKAKMNYHTTGGKELTDFQMSEIIERYKQTQSGLTSSSNTASSSSTSSSSAASRSSSSAASSSSSSASSSGRLPFELLVSERIPQNKEDGDDGTKMLIELSYVRPDLFNGTRLCTASLDYSLLKSELADLIACIQSSVGTWTLKCYIELSKSPEQIARQKQIIAYLKENETLTYLQERRSLLKAALRSMVSHATINDPAEFIAARAAIGELESDVYAQRLLMIQEKSPIDLEKLLPLSGDLRSILDYITGIGPSVAMFERKDDEYSAPQLEIAYSKLFDMRVSDRTRKNNVEQLVRFCDEIHNSGITGTEATANLFVRLFCGLQSNDPPKQHREWLNERSIKEYIKDQLTLFYTVGASASRASSSAASASGARALEGIHLIPDLAVYDVSQYVLAIIKACGKEDSGISSMVGTPGSPLNAVNATNETDRMRRNIVEQLAARRPTMEKFLFGANLSTEQNMGVHRVIESADPIISIFTAAGITATKNVNNTYTIQIPSKKNVTVTYSNSTTKYINQIVNKITETIPSVIKRDSISFPITSVTSTDVESPGGGNTAASSSMRTDKGGGARKTKSKPKKRNGTKHTKHTKHNRTKMGRLSARVIRRLDLRRSHRRSKPATTTTQRRTQRRRKSNQ